MFGISSFSAVINPPQACILAVGAGIKKVLPPVGGIISDGKPKPRTVTIVTVQLSADRRVVDEVVASQFLQVRSLIEPLGYLYITQIHHLFTIIYARCFKDTSAIQSLCFCKYTRSDVV